MITAILKKEICQVCRNCCKFIDEDVWDAPGFTKSELEKAKSIVMASAFEKSGLYYFVMEKYNEEYTCPLLSETGCLLGSEKPFKCAIWPLYVVSINNRLALTLSSECSTVCQLSNEEIISRLGKTVAKIKDAVIAAPVLVEENKSHFRFITYLD